MTQVTKPSFFFGRTKLQFLLLAGIAVLSIAYLHIGVIQQSLFMEFFSQAGRSPKAVIAGKAVTVSLLKGLQTAIGAAAFLCFLAALAVELKRPFRRLVQSDASAAVISLISFILSAGLGNALSNALLLGRSDTGFGSVIVASLITPFCAGFAFGVTASSLKPGLKVWQVGAVAFILAFLLMGGLLGLPSRSAVLSAILAAVFGSAGAWLRSAFRKREGEIKQVGK